MTDDTDGGRIQRDEGREASHVQWTVTFVRILAVWFLATGTVSAASILATLGAILNRTIPGASAAAFAYPTLVGLLAQFAVGAFLWRGAAGVARSVWADRRVSTPTTVLDPPVLQGLIRRGIGLWVLAHAAAAIPAAASRAQRARTVSARPSMPGSVSGS